jgi:hypothetical protein
VLKHYACIIISSGMFEYHVAEDIEAQQPTIRHRGVHEYGGIVEISGRVKLLKP